MNPAARLRLLLHLSVWCVLAACSGADGLGALAREAPAVDGRLFTLLPSSYTGVDFENRLQETSELNVFTYRNFYNGGGVALGDLNGDSLPDLVLTSNQNGNRLYLNQGDFRFRDVTEDAAVAGNGYWATGVTLVDIDADGRLDIYVAYAGNEAGDRRANELYLNQGVGEDGVPTFIERAAEWGIADEGYTTHAVFFDFDRDGQLDLYVLNNSFRPASSFGMRNIRHERSALGGDKLYRNVGGRFVDVSEKAGIFGSEIGFGLGVAVGDVNRDGWPDIYVSNDFFERDYLYLNTGKGSFTEVLDRQMPAVSYFSMGSDIADIDNDGWLDIYTTDMLPEDDYRLKMMSSFEGWDLYRTKLKNDYHHQFMRNMLQMNNGDGTFSEVGQMAGVARTDWSWSALIADFDQDGLKDIHVTNGMPRDLTSQDFISFLANDQTMVSAAKGDRVDFLRFVKAMSSTPLPDYAFRNRGDLTFANVSAEWGLDAPAFSNGAAYADLDGDGALDLVVNNTNHEVSIYRNNARKLLENRYLQIGLEGEGPNRYAVGARVTLRTEGRDQVQELIPSRGFQSSMDYVLTFGIGTADSVESVTVEWPDGRTSVRRNVAANQRLVVRQSGAAPATPAPAAPATQIFAEVSDRAGLDFEHRENEFVDFDRESLIPKLLSTDGPFAAVADVNGDGREDAFLGGAKDQAGALLLQRPDGRFAAGDATAFEADRASEDLGAAFFDANGDGHQDLYVVSGGNDFSDVSPALQDRLYLNDGRGRFRKAVGHLPAESVSGSRVAPADFDGDGDLDLFVGGRVVPWAYGTDPASVLLRNDGRGRFTDVTAKVAPALARVGMVTDALWLNLVGDRRPELVLVGEWMPITIFRISAQGRLEPMAAPGLGESHGWWNRVVAGDFTGDGRVDLVVGNLGLNGRLQASAREPATLYVKDFDRNGFTEPILSYYTGGASHPLELRDDLLKQLPFLRSRFPSYRDYAGKRTSEVFLREELADAAVKKAYTFATSLARNDGDGSFTLIPLPREAQVAPIYGILPGDFDRDGSLDLLMAGNFDGVEPKIGRMHASYGLFLQGHGDGEFTPLRARQSGFFVPGQARDIQRVRTPGGELFIVTRNDDRPLAFRLTRPRPSR